MSTYTLIQPNVHLICNPLVRSSLEIEVILTSGGSWFEAEADRGRKHLMEHCIASRTADMDFITFKNYQFRENIMINAYTSQNSLAVTAKTHASKFTQALEKVLEMAITPTFDNDILTQEREIVLREISERRGSPDYKLHFWTMDQICQPGSADTHEVLGSSEQVALTTLGDMIRLQHQNLEQSNLIVIVSGGSVDESEATRIINEILNKAENPFIQSFAKTETKNPITFQPPNKLKSFQLQPLVHELAHEHADVSIFIPCTVGLENLATQNVFKELFLNYYGVIYHRLRDELGYIYSLHSSFLFNTQMLELNLSCELQYISAKPYANLCQPLPTCSSQPCNRCLKAVSRFKI